MSQPPAAQLAAAVQKEATAAPPGAGEDNPEPSLPAASTSASNTSDSPSARSQDQSLASVLAGLGLESFASMLDDIGVSAREDIDFLDLDDAVSLGMSEADFDKLKSSV